MNLQSIKEEFYSYYVSELEKKGQDTQIADNDNISIFEHKEEFKDFLKSKYHATKFSISKSIDKILKMNIENGKLVDSEEEDKKENDGKKLDDDFIKDVINEALQDEQVQKTLDIDQSGELDSEEVGIFLQNIQGASEENSSSYRISLDDITKGVEDIHSGEYQKKDVVLDDNSLKGQDATDALLQEAYLNDKVFNKIDENSDGIINLEEQEKFKNYIKDYDGYGDEVSLSDVKSAYYDILNKDFSYKNNLSVDNINTETIDKFEDYETYSPSSSSMEVASPKNYYGSAQSSSTSTIQAKTVDNMTLEELNNARTIKQTEVNEAKEALNSVYSDDNETVKNAKENLDNAQKEYTNALQDEINTQPEIKALFLNVYSTVKQIESTQQLINDTNIDITNTQNDLNSAQSVLNEDTSNLSALKSALSLLQSQELTDEQKTKVQDKINSLNGQITELEEKIEKQDMQNVSQLNEKLQILQGKDGILGMEEKLQTLTSQKEEQEKQIEDICTKETLQAKTNYDNAMEQYNSIKQQEIESANIALSTAQTELNDIEAKISQKEAEKIERENKPTKYDFDFETNLTTNQQAELDIFKENYEQNKEKYEEVEQATGVPAELIAAIHWRESGGNFNTYLHNGDPLGKKMVHEPKIEKVFDDWTEGAIDAINSQNPSIVKEDDINTLFEYAERYNGLGYRKRGINSPYVWSGTTNYSSGKYVADGKFDSSAVDKQLGVAVMLEALYT